MSMLIRSMLRVAAARGAGRAARARRRRWSASGASWIRVPAARTPRCTSLAAVAFVPAGSSCEEITQLPARRCPTTPGDHDGACGSQDGRDADAPTHIWLLSPLGSG